MRSIRLYCVGLAAVLNMMHPALPARSQSRNPEATHWYQLGLEEQNLAKKTAAFAKAAELDPQLAGAHYQLGLLYKTQKEYHRAEASLFKAYSAQVIGDNLELKQSILYELVATYHELGTLADYEETLRRTKRLTSAPKVRTQISLDLGRLLHREQRYQEALLELREVLQLDPPQRSEVEELIRSAELGLEVVDLEVDGLYAQARKARANNNPQAAKALLERVKDRRPGYKNVEAQIAQLNAQIEGARTQTIAATAELPVPAKPVERAVNPNNEATLTPAVQIAGKLQQQATEDTSAAAPPALLDSLYQAALIAMEKQDWQQAALTLESLQMLQPDYRDAIDRLKLTRAKYGAEAAAAEPAPAAPSHTLVYSGAALLAFVLLLMLSVFIFSTKNRARRAR